MPNIPQYSAPKGLSLLAAAELLGDVLQVVAIGAELLPALVRLGELAELLVGGGRIVGGIVLFLASLGN